MGIKSVHYNPSVTWHLELQNLATWRKTFESPMVHFQLKIVNKLKKTFKKLKKTLLSLLVIYSKVVFLLTTHLLRLFFNTCTRSELCQESNNTTCITYNINKPTERYMRGFMFRTCVRGIVRWLYTRFWCDGISEVLYTDAISEVLYCRYGGVKSYDSYDPKTSKPRK